MKKLLILFCSLLLNGVFGTDEVKVSVNEGDSVTLEIKPEDRKGDSSLVWRFNGKTEILGKLFLANKKSEVIDPKDRIFGNRLKLNNQTGSLTITNITPEHSGLYVIKASIDTIKTFRVSVIGLSSHWTITGPVLLGILLLVLLLVVLYVIYKLYKKQKSKKQKTETILRGVKYDNEEGDIKHQ